MTAPVKQKYEGKRVQNFEFYLEHSGEHRAILRFVHLILPEEFRRIGTAQSSLDVLGVGSGGGQVDVQMLALLQSVFPTVPVTADIVDNCGPLTDHFKELISKSADLQKIPFTFHMMKSEEYESRVKATGDEKKFDFIHMIQMIHFVEDLAGSIQFFHSLLKSNGRLMIIVEEADGSWEILWKLCKRELYGASGAFYCSSGDVVACLKSLGLKYQEHVIPNSFDISECFRPGSETGARLLDFIMAQDDFEGSFSPEVRAGILELLKNKCSVKKDGKILFNSGLVALLVEA